MSESAPIREMKRRSIPSRCARPTSGQSGFNGARQRSAGGGRCSRAVSARADQRARRSRTHSITMIMMWGASAAAFRAEAAWDSDNTASSGPRVDIIGSYALGAGAMRSRSRATISRDIVGSMQCDFPVIKELGLVVTVVDGGLTDP